MKRRTMIHLAASTGCVLLLTSGCGDDSGSDTGGATGDVPPIAAAAAPTPVAGGPAPVAGTAAPTGTAGTAAAPAPTDPVLGQPTPTDPAPTDPAPTDPAPTDPAPTDPAPTDPAPAVDFPGELSDWCTGQPDNFSFFVASMDAMWTLSGSTLGDLQGGFGGNLGGIAGADAICQTIAQATGNGHKTWHAFLSATDDGSGNPVHAIERVGEGPWYDANGLLVATGVPGLLAAARPDGDPASVDDLPDECGIPLSVIGDAHDIITGSDDQGRVSSTDPSATCNDWTSTDASLGQGGDGGGFGGGGGLGTVMCGHSFPRGGSGGFGGFGGANWLSDHALRGCTPGANLLQDGPGSGTCIGCSGGYGGIYCFAI